MRFLNRLLVFFAVLICLQIHSSLSINAQEIRKTINDYRRGHVFNYHPNDPLNRSKLFNIHTRNYGKFYNCDGEENKRHSPYIYWRAHTESDFPPRVGIFERAKRDIEEVKQRYRDGAGACAKNGQCESCTNAHRLGHPVQCAQCSQTQSEITNSSLKTKLNASNRLQPKADHQVPENQTHGLIKVTNVDMQRDFTSVPASSVAKKTSDARGKVLPNFFRPTSHR